VKRVGVIGVGLGLLAAGLLAASVLAATSSVFGGATDTTSSTVTATAPESTAVPTESAPPTTATTTAAATTVPAPKPPPAPKPKPTQDSQRLPTGVTIGGIHVGGLGPDAAYQTIRLAFESPLRLVAAGTQLSVAPETLGAVAYVKQALAEARRATPHAAVRLQIRVQGTLVADYVASLAKKLEKPAVDSSVVLSDLQPRVTKGASGLALDRKRTLRALEAALAANRRSPITLPLREVKPKIATTSFPVIVIRRDSNQLLLYGGQKLKRAFHVATGQSAYPTPLGRFQILVKWENPWWYPPNDPWAKGAKPIPPGPGNPLGTRWMGLSSPGVGIHGTPDAASIGYSLSHGCIRMLIPDAEWLFNQVDIGTPVFIVAA
jgi:lipoprotein-anchoring transpeptidase ErfK/SrfK